MSTPTIVAFALGMVVLSIHVMYACPLSTGTCKQYGHACLGGHGKRAENPNPHLMDYILRKIAQRSDENPDIASTRSDDLRSIFERSYKKKLDDWDNYSEDDWRSNIFNGMN
ncbi:uncharacterized protein CDAR_563021 [Caerostris darwini]|uniref:Uncharacterized protein n=1 Tax=Caerostris darwini TaxID=1538125 RepID=A0AAV4T989_9ARAC|nr:uncharacterized protein CDAR_563021 [Caerostris darwini]